MANNNLENAENLEQALEKLEVILREMEEGKLPLEDLISRFEDGVKLVKTCQDRLQAAEKRIQKITKDFMGNLNVEEAEILENE